MDGARAAIKTRAQAAGMEGFISGCSLRVDSAISLAKQVRRLWRCGLQGGGNPHMSRFIGILDSVAIGTRLLRQSGIGSPRRDCTIEIQGMKQGGRNRFWRGGKTIHYK